MAPRIVRADIDPRAAAVPPKYRPCRGGIHALPEISDGPGEFQTISLATDWLTVLIHRTCRRCGVVKFEERYSGTGQLVAEPTYSNYPDGYLAERGTGRMVKSDFHVLTFADMFPKAIRA